jgi:sugar transferase (PEP-CTERM system associated)
MIRLFHVFFPGRTLLLAATEGLVSSLTLLLAVYLWFGRDTDLALRYDYGVMRIALASFVFILCMYYGDLYDSLVLRSFREVISRVVQVLGTVCIVLAAIYYAYPELEIGRGPMATWVVISAGCLVLWRRLYVSLSVSTQMSDRSALLGDGPLAPALVAEISTRPEFSLHLVGYIAPDTSTRAEMAGLRHMGTVGELEQVIQREDISRVIISMGDRRGQLPVERLLHLKTKGVVIQDGADVYERLTGKVPVRSLRLSWLLFSDGFRISRWTLTYKRAASIVLSLLGLVLALPVMAVVALAIRLDSAGRAIFKQKRVGKDGRTFTLWKFRSMREHADPNLPAQPDDERITRVGRWIRRCRLDELPQLFNILRGDMSLVGPRPFTPAAEEECAREIPFYNQRWSIKPGATGWAQIMGGYCSTLDDNVEKLGYDLYYIKNISIGLDCLIVFHTIKILLLGRGAR